MQFKKEGLHESRKRLQEIGGLHVQENATTLAVNNLSSVAFSCWKCVVLIPSF